MRSKLFLLVLLSSAIINTVAVTKTAQAAQCKIWFQGWQSSGYPGSAERFHSPEEVADHFIAWLKSNRPDYTGISIDGGMHGDPTSFTTNGVYYYIKFTDKDGKQWQEPYPVNQYNSVIAWKIVEYEGSFINMNFFRHHMKWATCDPEEPEPEPKKYTIKLSPVTAQAYGNYLTAIEPDGITRSGVPQNLINKVNLVAEVKDQDGNPVNAAIKLKVTALEDSGGHAQDSHTERNPSQAGKLKVGSFNSDTINIPKSGMVGGIVEFEYAASAISGDHKIEASCIGITCKQIGKDSVWVGIQDLRTLPASSNYTFTGGSCHHQNNHYATERVIQKLQGIGREYRSQFPNDPFLYFNDISLVRGGLFDAKNEEKHCSPVVKANWTATHNLHRTGEDVDVRANNLATAIPKANYDEFEEIATLNGCNAGIHKGGTTAQHYHLYCTKKQDKK